MNDYDGRAERERYLIGRGADCQILLVHPSISKMHCCLIAEVDGGYTLSDMGSSNGVQVKRGNQWVRIKDERVSPQDEVLIGSLETTVSALLLKLQGATPRAARKKDKIFISYRRLDSEQVAGRMFDRLSAVYGPNNIFFDTEAIPGAVDFRTRVQSAVQQSAVVLVVIGNEWFAPLTKFRLFDFFHPKRKTEDFVQGEIEAAIQWRVPIVPLLVNGAAMPKPQSLPASVRDIAYLNAIGVRSGRDFHDDMSAVVDVINQYYVRDENKSL
jgi:FHA domain/TIR domain